MGRAADGIARSLARLGKVAAGLRRPQDIVVPRSASYTQDVRTYEHLGFILLNYAEDVKGLDMGGLSIGPI